MSSTNLILKEKYPAKSHAKRVASYLQTAGYPKEGVIYLESQKTRLIEDNDEPVPFRYARHVILFRQQPQIMNTHPMPCHIELHASRPF